MGCSRIKGYSDRGAIGEEHTHHNWCSCSSFSDLHVVNTSCLVGALLLLVCPGGALCLSGWKAPWLRALSKKVSYFSTIETRILGSLSLRWGRCSGIPLLLRRPIILRPLNNLLLCWPDDHLLLPLLLIWRPERCLISHSRALWSASRGTNCDPCFPLFKMMKTEVFFHSNGIINQLIEILETTAQTGPKFRTH